MKTQAVVKFTNELGTATHIDVTNNGRGQVNYRVVGAAGEIESLLTYEEARQLRVCLAAAGC